MFNRTYIVRPPSVSVHATTTVTEKRAPTDESVALLKEMESAARKKIVDAVMVSNTLFECVVHRELDLASDKEILRAVFKVNGHQMTAEHSYWRRDGGPDARTKHADGLRDAVAKAIASECLHDAFVALMTYREA